MSSVSPIDEGRSIDWGKTSADYSVYRPGPPESFHRKLLALDVGRSSQRILDLGTGTGVLARQFAQQGAVVAGIDISAEQIQAARSLADAENLEIDFRVAPAEEAPFPDRSFDVTTANQCWRYFDRKKAIAEVKRLLVEEGLLVMSREIVHLFHAGRRGSSTSRRSSTTMSQFPSPVTPGGAGFERPGVSERHCPRMRFSYSTRSTTPC